MNNKIRNIYTSELEPEQSHGGKGFLKKVRAFQSMDFKTPLDFIDFVIVPPDVTIGKHTHGDNEEVYFIMEGQGTMILDNKQYTVKRGDIIVNEIKGTHQLHNTSQSDMSIFIFQISNRGDK